MKRVSPRQRVWWLAGLLGLAGAIYLASYWPSRGHTPASGQIARTDEGYVDSQSCAGCHPDVSQGYAKTGMARSFSIPTLGNTIGDVKKNSFYHKASDSTFTMFERDGKYFQRRSQIDFRGEETNVAEKEIDYVMGSGNHVRTYLHRTVRNTLVELPLAWYPEDGGYWAMNPGYDHPDHPGFRRRLTYDCMFCHNAYPEIGREHDEPGAEPVFPGRLPEGIDCQRCHGPGRKHVQLAGTGGARKEDIRKAIVNPSRLSAERQGEICMQCHLETTSLHLPDSIRRYGRGPFSYRPGESLGDFKLYFDHAPGTGYDDKFEIVNAAAYRLRLSACFRASNGAPTCTACHDPHKNPGAEEAAQHYTRVCRQCHRDAFDRLVATGKHSQSDDCVGCHMPKRRTEDVVHAVMTDHYIQRRKPARDLLAPIQERAQSTDKTTYRGKVVLYYPQQLPQTPESELDLAVAQVSQNSNLTEGISQLAAAIVKYHPPNAQYYLDLADAWRQDGRVDQALPLYEEAVRMQPASLAALRKLGSALRSSRQYAQAADILNRALAAAPDEPETWYELGMVYLYQGKTSEAVAPFGKAVELDPDLSEAYNSLATAWFESGDSARAETAFREAIRIQPDFAEAHTDLGNILSAAGRFEEARYHFEIALRFYEGTRQFPPNYATTQYDYGLTLVRIGRFEDARRHTEAALRSDPGLAGAHELLGELLSMKGEAQGALQHYREAATINPDLARAQLNLGVALAALGDVSDALPHLRKAAEGSDSAARDKAVQMLRRLGQ